VDRELDTQSFLNLSTGNPITGNAVTMENSVQRYSTELQYKDHAFRDLYYIVGVSAEYDETDPALFIDKTDGSTSPLSPIKDKEKTNNFAFYAQGKYRFNDKLVGIVGARIEDNSDTGNALNPRVGLNYEYFAKTYFKLLYSEAYRSPAFIEKYADVPNVLLGDKTLDREKIRTIELGFDSQLNQQNSLQVTTFYSELENQITRRTQDSGKGTQYYNGPDLKTYGLEIALNSIINDKTELMINGSYVDGKQDPDDHVDFIANFTANAMLTYHFTSQWSATLSDQYIGAKSYHTTSNEDGEVDAYNLTNISLSYVQRPFEANLYLKNIFDVSYSYPEPVRSNLKELPGGAGISTYLTLRYYF